LELVFQGPLDGKFYNKIIPIQKPLAVGLLDPVVAVFLSCAYYNINNAEVNMFFKNIYSTITSRFPAITELFLGNDSRYSL